MRLLSDEILNFQTGLHIFDDPDSEDNGIMYEGKIKLGTHLCSSASVSTSPILEAICCRPFL